MRVLRRTDLDGSFQRLLQPEQHGLQQERKSDYNLYPSF